MTVEKVHDTLPVSLDLRRWNFYIVVYFPFPGMNYDRYVMW